MNFSEEEYSSLERLFNSRTAEFRRDGDLLFKNYYFLKSESKEVLEYLINKPHILNSGYPIDEFFINDKFKGIVINYFEDAVPFLLATDFSIEEKVKASNDIFEQLKVLHSYEMCFNDVQSANLLIDKKGGHLVDFDSSSFIGSTRCSCYYNFIDFDGKILCSSVRGDLYKMLICCLSFLYNIDLEKIFNCSSNLDVFFYLFLNTSVDEIIRNDFINMIDDGEFGLNIDGILPFLLDSERYNYDLEQVKENVKSLR